MGENLVIVESPAKAKTIEKILGKDYEVKSSFGHIRDLSKKKLGIKIDEDFLPVYEVSSDKEKVVEELRKASSKATTVWLASDEDREGEAIAWHLQQTLELNPEKTKRIVFHEITKDAILHAIENPRDVNLNLVMAQQARRVIDRLVGFELSPILWKKVQPKLSAGRVQSVALRLVVEKEREINAFQSKQYFKVEGVFVPQKGDKRASSATVKGVLNKKFSCVEETRHFLELCKGASFSVSSIEKKETTKTPPPPFTTSSLQQEASRKCGFSVSQTMSIAQKLYEQGLITYMRTDSTNLSKVAIGAAKGWITENLGTQYHKARQFKTAVKGAQEAHEAIRPTNIFNTEISATSAEKRLYNLIWKRTVASQMADERLEKTQIEIAGSNFSEHFDVLGTNVLFDGFLKLYIESHEDESSEEEDEVILPSLAVSDIMLRKEIRASEKSTTHSPRYSEASLVRKMEELGIGRPSTYAPTISTLHQRGYITKHDKEGEAHPVTILTLTKDTIEEKVKTEVSGSEKAKLFPEDIGIIVTDFLEKRFPSIMDYGFTANVEADFDKIAAGKLVWNKLVADFYSPFHDIVESVESDKEHLSSRRVLGTDPATGKCVIARMGRFGSLVQIGEDDDPDKKFASLQKGMLIDTVTLDEALKLFALPRVLGEYNGESVVCSVGRFGPYIKYRGKYTSLRKNMDPYSVTLGDAIELIKESEEKELKKHIKQFPEQGIEILQGRFGPYIKCAGENYKIPKTKNPVELTVQECLEIINAPKPKKKTKK